MTAKSRAVGKSKPHAPEAETVAGAPPAISADVAAVFDALPAAARQRIMKLRGLVYEAAAGDVAIGSVTEALRWGQVSYLTLASKSGTTIRLDYRADTKEVVFFVHCQTTLVSTYRALYPTEFDYEGDRAVIVRAGRLPINALRHCFALALTYHIDRRKSRQSK